MMSGFLEAVTQRPFWSETQIKELVRHDNEKKAQNLYGGTSRAAPAGPPAKLRAMLIFTTEKERTWLVVDQGMACWVLDDRRRERPQIWRTKLEEALPVRANETGSDRIGALKFGNRAKEWLYSKDLFSSEQPTDAIQRFLSSSSS